MEIKGNGRGCPKGPYHKPPKTLSKNNQNHTKRANLMEITRNGKGFPGGPYQKQRKPLSKNHQDN
jgi:hypothetical protein